MNFSHMEIQLKNAKQEKYIRGHLHGWSNCVFLLTFSNIPGKPWHSATFSVPAQQQQHKSMEKK